VPAASVRSFSVELARCAMRIPAPAVRNYIGGAHVPKRFLPKRYGKRREVRVLFDDVSPAQLHWNISAVKLEYICSVEANLLGVDYRQHRTGSCLGRIAWKIFSINPIIPITQETSLTITTTLKCSTLVNSAWTQIRRSMVKEEVKNWTHQRVRLVRVTFKLDNRPAPTSRRKGWTRHLERALRHTGNFTSASCREKYHTDYMIRANTD
jgi:hypothetical protein